MQDFFHLPEWQGWTGTQDKDNIEAATMSERVT
jgi:hypothetical protein